MPIKNVPSTVSELLERCNTDYKRSSHQKGNFYYKHKTYDSRRITFKFPEKKFIISSVYNGRKEILEYHYQKGILIKYFHENGWYINPYRQKEYTFFKDEDKYFQESLLQDKYFPTFADMQMIEQLLDYYRQDTFNWIRENERKREQRYHDNYKKYRTKFPFRKQK